MDVKQIGERLRKVRKHLGLSQQDLAKVTNITQPAISRLENGEEVYDSTLLTVLSFYRDKISLDVLLDQDLDDCDESRLYYNPFEARQKIDHQLSIIAHDLDDSLKKITELRNKLKNPIQ